MMLIDNESDRTCSCSMVPEGDLPGRCRLHNPTNEQPETKAPDMSVEKNESNVIFAAMCV